jgi:integrase
MTGLCPGEALGLRWSDISENAITVQRALIASGKQWKVAEPKTRRSRRTVPLSNSMMKALHAHRRAQAEEKLRSGNTYSDNGSVFANPKGLPLDVKNLTHRHFRKVLRAAGLPTIRLYDRRHTAATLMLSAGVNPKVASERLGHSTITLTMDTYSHVLPDMQQDAIDRVDPLLMAAGNR